jgi:hypothetical protein
MTKITEENLSQIKYAEHINVTKGYIIYFVVETFLSCVWLGVAVKGKDSSAEGANPITT